MKSLRLLILLLFGISVFSLQLFSQGAPRTFRVLNLAGKITSLTSDGTGQGAMLYFDSDAGKPVTVPVPAGQFPRARPIPPGGELKLYRYEMAPADTPPEAIIACCRVAVAAGKPRKVFVATVRIPAGYERALVILTPAPGDDPRGKLDTHVYDGSPGIHKSDTVLVFNATPSDVALKLGENILEIPARGVRIGPFIGEEGAIQVKLGLRSPGGDWKLALTTVHSARPGYRVLAVIRPLTDDPRTPPVLNLDYEYAPPQGPLLARKP
ncbi:hypothetical protein OPIT5_01765 [Opitutaceae bacterium TAV5]|nr:hypothetical protein OPIT5_01765 [Opitutaceae bacterium TAV5]